MSGDRIATGITSGIIVRAGLRGLAAAAAVALVVYGFSAYLDPAVYLSALSVFALC